MQLSGTMALMRTCTFRTALDLLFCLALTTAPAVSQDEILNRDTSVGELESLVSEWVDLRSRFTAEEHAWHDQKERLVEAISLLETEREALKKELAEADAQVTSAEEEATELLEDKQRMERALAALEPFLDRAEADLRRWKKWIPAPLQSELFPLFSHLESAAAAEADSRTTRRLQRVVALYSQIEALQNSVQTGKEMLALDGSVRREMDVLYVGLARGFAVSGDGREAAVGRPGPGGWVWERRPGSGAEFRKAIAVFNRRMPAQFVSLPLATDTADTETAP